MTDTARKFLKVILSVVIIAAVVYIASVILFYNRFGPGVSYNNTSLFYQKPESVIFDSVRETKSRKVILKGRNGSYEELTFGQLGVSDKRDGLFFSVDLNPWLWFDGLFHPVNYTVSSEYLYNRSNLREKISNFNLVMKGKEEPSQASVRYDDDGSFYIISGRDGDVIDQERLLDVLCSHLDDMDLVIDLDKENCYKTAEMGDLDQILPGDFSSYDFIRGLNIQIKLHDGCIEKVPSAVLSEVVTNENDTPVFHTGFLSDYVDAVAMQYDTTGQYLFHTSDNGDISIDDINSVLPQYKIDTNKLLVDLSNAVLDKKDAVVNVNWLSEGVSHKKYDIGDTYIEISLQEQHLWFYKEGVLIIDSDVVTGNTSAGHGTLDGLYRVISLNRNYTMYYDDGSAKCDYFIKISGDGIGIHDASWRDAFGGDIWKTEGSHGCVNVPHDCAEKVFNTLSDMQDFYIPVVIY